MAMNGESDKDLSEIISFLDKSKSVISKIVNNPKRFFRKEFYEDSQILLYMQKAWDDVDNSLKVSIEDIMNKWNLKDTQDIMQQRGLIGSQLKFKILIFNKFYERFINNKDNWLLKELLAIINSILRSLGFEGLSEFKEMIEPMIKSDICPTRNDVTDRS